MAILSMGMRSPVYFSPSFFRCRMKSLESSVFRLTVNRVMSSERSYAVVLPSRVSDTLASTMGVYVRIAVMADILPFAALPLHAARHLDYLIERRL